MTDEQRIAALADYLIEETWVREVVVSGGAPWPNDERPGIVEIICTLELAPTHSGYLPPRPGERVNARMGSIRIFGVSQLAWSGMGWQAHDELDRDWWVGSTSITQAGRRFRIESVGRSGLGTLDIDADEIEILLWPERN